METELRIALCQGGRIIDEQRLQRGDRYALPAPFASALPAGHRLFEPRGRRMVLCAPAGVEGESALPGSAPAPIPEGELELAEHARGWIAVGGARVLFQLESLPAPAPKGELPRQVRTGFLGTMETRFLSVLAAVLVVEGAIIGWMAGHPPQLPEVSEAEVLGAFKAFTVRPPPPASSKAPQPVRKPRGDGPVVGRDVPPADRERLRELVNDKGLLNVIAATRGKAAFGRVFDSDAGIGEIDEAMAEAKGKLIVGGFLPTRPRRPGEVEAAVIGTVWRAPTAGRVETWRETIVKPPPVVEACAGADCDDAPRGLIEQIARELKQRVGAVQDCYEQAMRRHGAARGRIALRFVVGTNGALTGASIETNTLGAGADEVAACVIRRTRSWNFAVRPDAPVAVSFPFLLSPGD